MRHTLEDAATDSKESWLSPMSWTSVIRPAGADVSELAPFAISLASCATDLAWCARYLAFHARAKGAFM